MRIALDDDAINKADEAMTKDATTKAAQQLALIKNVARSLVEEDQDNPFILATVAFMQGKLAQALQILADNGVDLSSITKSDDPADTAPDGSVLTAINGDTVEEFVKVLDAQGNLSTTLNMRNDSHRREYDRLVGQGYVRPMTDGKVVELRPHSASQQMDDPDPEVPVHNKDDQSTSRKVKVSVGNADPKLEAIPGQGGKISHFREKKAGWGFK